MADAAESFLSCDHEFEPFVADPSGGRVPYHFCRKCKSTLLHGLVRQLKPWDIHSKYKPKEGKDA